jgi:DNA-binding response OmpR family regulator
MEVATREEPAIPSRQPWGMLPPRMRVLFVTNSSHTGSWLAEAFAADSATRVILEETVGVVHGLARLRDEIFDVVLIAHDTQELNALEIVDAVRTSASPSQPIIVLGSEPAAELEAVCLESGADAYLTWDTTTTRSLIWQIARACERHQLIEENRQLRQAQLHQRDVDEAESHRMLEIQRRLAEGLAATTAASEALHASERTSGWQPPQQLVDHYGELLQTYVIMGAGNLDDELHRLSGVLVATGIGARQFMRIHLSAVESMVRDLGKRSARHVMNRADMLAIEVLLCLCEGFRERVLETIRPSSRAS